MSEKLKVVEVIECWYCNGDGYIDDENNPNGWGLDCPACNGRACWTKDEETK